MKLEERFSCVEHYIAWVKLQITSFVEVAGYELIHPELIEKFAETDWSGGNEAIKAVYVLYNELHNQYKDDYKSLTELVMIVNHLAWVNDALCGIGIGERDSWVGLYSELYYEARDDFYDRWGNDDEACEYFFQTTD